jgi:hypothetical protein
MGDSEQRLAAIVRRAAHGAILAAALLGCGGARAEAAGLDPQRPETLIGQWEMSQDATGRKCRLVLRIEPTGTGAHILALPYGCRKAFVILANVRSWTLTPEGLVALEDADGHAMLQFAAESPERLFARGPDMATYRLTAAHALAAAAPRAAEPEKLATQAPSPAPAQALRASDLSGRYAILREGGRDTGCMLTLDDKTPAKRGSKAFLAPACRDHGIVIFDPVAWRIASGRLVLTARKGHSTQLDLQPDGTWQKDPKDGKGLGLKKL